MPVKAGIQYTLPLQFLSESSVFTGLPAFAGNDEPVDNDFRKLTAPGHFLGGCTAGPDLLPGKPFTPLVSGGVAFWSDFTAGPDLLPGMPGVPAPLFGVFCAKAADPSNSADRAAAAIIFVRIALPRILFVPSRKRCAWRKGSAGRFTQVRVSLAASAAGQ